MSEKKKCAELAQIRRLFRVWCKGYAPWTVVGRGACADWMMCEMQEIERTYTSTNSFLDVHDEDERVAAADMLRVLWVLMDRLADLMPVKVDHA